MSIELKLFNKRLKILTIFIIAGILIWLPRFFETKSQITEADFDITKNSDLEIPEYLIIQSNSFLSISTPASYNLASNNFCNGEKLIITVTAYHPGEPDLFPCLSASGVNICETDKNIVACSRKYPFGTKFLINGAAYYCEDRLNIKYDDRIDLLVKNEKEMKKWGKRTIEVIKID